jgi:hypothetical protein
VDDPPIGTRSHQLRLSWSFGLLISARLVEPAEPWQGLGWGI